MRVGSSPVHTRPVGLCGEQSSSTEVSGSASSRSNSAQSYRLWNQSTTADRKSECRHREYPSTP